MNKNIFKPMLFGMLASVFLFLAFGGITAVFVNPFFTRMTPAGWIEWFFLITTSILLGTYIALFYYLKSNKLNKCNTLATSGGILGFLTFGCSLCNKILILILGVTGILTYFEPLRPWLGIISFILLGYANYALIRIIKKNCLA